LRSATLRAGLRHKEDFFWMAARHDSAALDSLRSSRAKRSSRALTLVWWRRMKQIPTIFHDVYFAEHTSAAEAEV
jgi:hypothetical protein